MRRQAPAIIFICLLACGIRTSAQQDALQLAARTLSVASIKTLEFKGAGRMFSVGQNYTASDPWPPVTVSSFTATIDYDATAMRVDLVREMGTVMPRGGGAPFTGQQRQIQFVSGRYAWNVAAPASAGDPAPPATPAAPTQLERMLALWATPQGFVNAALTNNATVRVRGGLAQVSFAIDGKYRMTGTIDPQGLVTSVQTWVDHPIVGDMTVETAYAGYQNLGGVMFPTRIVQTQDGHPSLDLTVSAVSSNPSFTAVVPENVRDAPAAVPARVTSEELAEGVFYLTGGSHHSLAIGMRDYIVVVDVPNNEDRALAVLAAAKELIPNKPIRYVATSHHHWDHLGGIRAAIDEGATILTHRSNRVFLERVAKTRHTLVPDRLALSKKRLKIRTMGDRSRLSDRTRTVEFHRLQGYEHAGDMMVVYLPNEQILAEPDAFSPPARAGMPLVVTAVPAARALYDNIQRLKLDVRVIVPFHGGRTSDVAELASAAGVGGTY